MFSTNDLSHLNLLALEAIANYQSLMVNGMKVSAPYVINTVQLELKKAMVKAGLVPEQVNSVLSLIKNGDTELGSNAGKGDPQQLQADLERVVSIWNSTGSNLKEAAHVQELMRIHLIGIDCSGFVYNVFKLVFAEYGFDQVQSLFDWTDQNVMRASRAGAFVFNSEKLMLIDPRKTQELDIWLYDNTSHVGVVVRDKDELFLADSSPVHGVSKFRIIIDDEDIFVENRLFWTMKLQNNKVIVRRLPNLHIE